MPATVKKQRPAWPKIARGFFLVLGLTLLILLWTATTQAQTVNWLNNTGVPSPYYHNGLGNWSGNNRPSSTATAQFNISGNYDVWWSGLTQGLSPSVGRINVFAGDVTFESQTSTQYEMIINGNGGPAALNLDGSSTFLRLEGVHLNSFAGAKILNGSNLYVDGAHAAGAQFSISSGSLQVEGFLSALSGGVVNSTTPTFVGQSSGTTGVVLVNDSMWNGGYLSLGNFGTGLFTVTNNSIATVSNVSIADENSGQGSMTVSGAQLDCAFTLEIGNVGDGTLSVSSAGVVTSGTGIIARNGGSTSFATVDGIGSNWLITNDLTIGGNVVSSGGTATVTIDNGGSISVGGTTRLWSSSTVNLNDGTFDFGQMAYDEFASINAVSGSLAGTINLTGYHDASSLAHFNNAAIDVSGIDVSNGGTLYGDSIFAGSLTNTTSGEIETVVGERMRFAGSGNVNAGEINNFGGTIRFDQDLTNQLGGFVSGRGQFVANGGWTNQGVMAFSGGPTDVLGDVDNQSGGRIVTAGGSTTTFYDDVVHNGTEIHTAAGSNTVFFGSQSGAGAFTGTGTVFYQGDLRPGNSPAVVTHEGSLVLGSTVSTFIELGGRLEGEFDQFQIDGDLDLDGSLAVEMIDGFQLSANDSFVIAEIDGNLNGEFNNFGEGDIVGNFSGHDLFISYAGGDGNDVTLFTAVPEPASGAVLFVALIGLVFRRKSRFRNPATFALSRQRGLNSSTR